MSHEVANGGERQVIQSEENAKAVSEMNVGIQLINAQGAKQGNDLIQKPNQQMNLIHQSVLHSSQIR